MGEIGIGYHQQAAQVLKERPFDWATNLNTRNPQDPALALDQARRWLASADNAPLETVCRELMARYPEDLPWIYKDVILITGKTPHKKGFCRSRILGRICAVRDLALLFG